MITLHGVEHGLQRNKNEKSKYIQLRKRGRGSWDGEDTTVTDGLIATNDHSVVKRARLCPGRTNTPQQPFNARPWPLLRLESK